MAAGTTVILNFRPLSPPPPAALSRLQNRIFPVKSATVCRESLAGSRCRRLNLTTVRASQRPSQAAFGGNNDYSTAVLTLATELQNFVLANFLPLALACGVILGITCPKLGCVAHRYSLSKFSTFGIFFISGLKLQGGEIREIAEAWPAFVYGLVSILLLSPLFSKLILKVQLVPQEFVTGLAVFSCMPTALSSGVALTQLVGGNSALALALTVMSNLLGILFVPFWISKFLADGFGVAIPTGSLLRSLLITLLVPLVLGKALRTSFHGLARYVDQNRKVLSRMSTILLSFTPWMQVSKTRPLLMLMKPEVFLQAIVMGILVHVSSLIFNAFMVRSLSIAPYAWKAIFMKKENTRALLLVCSQRALVIAVAVVEQLGDALGESGLLILPCVAAHMNQIIFNSLLVNFWLQKDQSFNSAKQC